jgi:uncharacterized membrane protein (UPF0127 family)
MPWLVRDGEVLASLDVADSLGSRLRGLLGQDHCEGALLITHARSVHTLFMRFPIDVAFCDRDLNVVAVCTMARYRLGRPRPRARCVVEAEAGAFERWRLKPGDHLEVRG